MTEIIGQLVDVIQIHDDKYCITCDYDTQLYSLIRVGTNDMVARGTLELIEYHIQRLKRGEQHGNEWKA